MGGRRNKIGTQKRLFTQRSFADNEGFWRSETSDNQFLEKYNWKILEKMHFFFF